MKVVVNRCFGGFGLSDAAKAKFKEIEGVRSTSGLASFARTHYWSGWSKSSVMTRRGASHAFE